MVGILYLGYFFSGGQVIKQNQSHASTDTDALQAFIVYQIDNIA